MLGRSENLAQSFGFEPIGGEEGGEAAAFLHGVVAGLKLAAALDQIAVFTRTATIVVLADLIDGFEKFASVAAGRQK